MENYFNTLPLRLQLEQLGVCEFMDQSEFADGVSSLKNKKVVPIIMSLLFLATLELLILFNGRY